MSVNILVYGADKECSQSEWKTIRQVGSFEQMMKSE